MARMGWMYGSHLRYFSVNANICMSVCMSVQWLVDSVLFDERGQLQLNPNRSVAWRVMWCVANALKGSRTILRFLLMLVDAVNNALQLQARK